MTRSKAHPSITTLALAVLVAFSTGGCGPPRQVDAPITQVPGPPGLYASAAWLDDWLVVQVMQRGPVEGGAAASARLWRFRPDGSHGEVPLPERASGLSGVMCRVP